MRRSAVIFGAVAAFVVVASVVAAATRAPLVREPTRIHVIEHAASDIVIDTGGAGDTAGDLLTFDNKVFDASNSKQVGRDQGDCIRIDPAHGKWECRWVTWVGGGSIAVEGPFYDTRDSVMAITGGTGRFANARGSMSLQARAGGTEYDFIFFVEP